MKPRPPAEIDSMMWAVAEDGNPRAAEEFRERFPEYGEELKQRMALVRSLRGANASADLHIPRFVPRQSRDRLPTGPRWPYAIGAAAVAAAGLAAYGLIARRDPSQIAQVPPISTALPSPSGGIVYTTDPPQISPSPVPTPTGTIAPSPTPTSQPSLPPYLQPQQFEFKDTKLADAIRMTCLAGKLDLQIAPGLPDIAITQSYPGYTPIQVLEALGREYGFTALEDGPHRVLVIPARDDGSGMTPLPTTRPNPDQP